MCRARRTSRVASRRASRSALTLRGVEGVAIQYAKCCRPIPGDTIVGQFRKGQGLLVHLRDCVTLKKQRVDAAELVDVEWSADVQGEFDAGVRVLVSRPPRPAGRPRDRDCRRATPTSTPSRWRSRTAPTCIAMFFGVQVRDRKHLASLMRNLRHIPDVRKVQRART